MTKLTEIEGIGDVYAQKLKEAGIETTDALLGACATPKGRKDLADSTGAGTKLIMKWANRVDLARIKGVGGEYADLLECAGIDTVPELGQRNAENLHAKITEVNAEKNLTRRLPSVDQVGAWVDQAKALPRVLTY